MKRVILFLVICVALLSARVSDKEIANMFLLGFYGTAAPADSEVCQDLHKGLAGVILFQNRPDNRRLAKNFSSAGGLRAMSSQLKRCAPITPLIAVDQEGGVVQRIKFTYAYPKAKDVAKLGLGRARAYYLAMAKELHALGINLNFAPVADIALNPKNRVIVGLGRSYGSNWRDVVRYDKVFIDAMHRYGVATTLKHFPGHGSSLGDTHKGFVDVTNLWKQVELQPYYHLKNSTDAVMVAHVFNRNLDANYPASLSSEVVTKRLRKQIGFQGVIISDDLQMGAIAKHYSLKKRIELSINAGVDIMLFANQLNEKSIVHLDKLVRIVRELLKEGAVSEASVEMANRRINRLRAKY